MGTMTNQLISEKLLSLTDRIRDTAKALRFSDALAKAHNFGKLDEYAIEISTLAADLVSGDRKMAPVQGYIAGIPWSLHLEAYDAYRKKYGPQKALIEDGCRGGFGTNELDVFIPGWRERVSEITALREEIERLKAQPPQQADGGAVAVGEVADMKYGRANFYPRNGRPYLQPGTKLYAAHPPHGLVVDEAMAIRAIEARNDFLNENPGDAVPAMECALLAAIGGEE